MGSCIVGRLCRSRRRPIKNGNPVGTGPYRLKSWVRGGQISLEKNPSYRSEIYSDQRLPLNDGIVFEVVKESQARIFKFLSGELDAVAVPLEFLPKIFGGANRALSAEYVTRGFKVSKVSQPAIFEFYFNMDDKIVGENKFLRKAMAAAFNSRLYIDTFFHGLAILAQSIVPPGMENYDPDYKNPNGEYDLKKAKALLAKSQYLSTGGAPTLVLDTVAGTSSRQQAEFFQQQMANIGIKIKVNQLSWNAFMESLRAGKGQIRFDGNGYITTNPGDVLKEYYGPFRSPGPNFSNYNNPRYNMIFKKWDESYDSKMRVKYERALRDILMEDLPAVPLAHGVDA